MNKRTLMTMALLGLAVVFTTAVPQLGFAQANYVGTWKFNPAKSKFSPGPPPRSTTLIYQAEGQGFRVTAEVIDAQGNPTKANLVIFVDGNSYPVTGVPDYDAASYKQINDSTWETTRTKAGKVVQTLTRVMSADGKTHTRTLTGVNASGQQINNVSVYEKQ
jgi:hypothetical protein